MHILYLSGLEYGQETDCCVCGHEPSGLIKFGEFIDYIEDMIGSQEGR